MDRSRFDLKYLSPLIFINFLTYSFIFIRWSVRDIGIWMADEIAKIETNEVSATFINSKVESNNNKIIVRDPEKQAKFPKKVALKSPKKTGVKKKNYYNTKLTFSKDPRNPKVEAAKNDALTSESIATELSDELVELDLLENENAIADSDEVDGDEGLEGNDENNDDGLGMSISDSDNEVTAVNNYENESDDNDDHDYDGDKEETEESVMIGEEMMDVNVFERKETEEVEVVEVAATTVPVSVIAAVDMIILSTFLSV